MNTKITFQQMWNERKELRQLHDQQIMKMLERWENGGWEVEWHRNIVKLPTKETSCKLDDYQFIKDNQERNDND